MCITVYSVTHCAKFTRRRCVANVLIKHSVCVCVCDSSQNVQYSVLQLNNQLFGLRQKCVAAVATNVKMNYGPEQERLFYGMILIAR